MGVFLRVLQEEVVTANLPPPALDFVHRLTADDADMLRGWLSTNMAVFVTCFCIKGDLLSQWRGYGGGSGQGGYSLGLTPSRGPAHTWVQSAGHGLSLRRVVYDATEQDRMCGLLISRLLNFLAAGPPGSDRVNAFTQNLVNGIAEFAARCKDPGFEEEDEWRIIYQRVDDPSGRKLEPKYRTSRGILVPYVELMLPMPVGARTGQMPLTQIVHGPSSEPEVAERGLRALLDDYDFGHVAVERSALPLRV